MSQKYLHKGCQINELVDVVVQIVNIVGEIGAVGVDGPQFVLI